MALLVLLLALLMAVAVHGDSLNVAPLVISEREAGQVTISWAVDAPRANLSLALYSPPSSEADDFIALEYVDGTSGTVNLTLVNIRDDYSVRLVVTTASRHHVQETLVSGPPVSFATRHAALEGWLAMTHDASEMRITFVVDTNTTGSVWWAPAGSDAWTQANATAVTTYTVEDMCDKPANAQGWRDPGFIYTAIMTGLKPGSDYEYRYGTAFDVSETYSFRALRKAGDDSVPTRFAMFGDMGVSPFRTGEYGKAKEYPPAAETVATLHRNGGQLDYAMLVGDISYARGYAWQWTELSWQAREAVRSMPFGVGVGNHEYDYHGAPFAPSWADYGIDSGGECGVPFERRFNMPGGSVATRDVHNVNNYYWAFETGLVHTVVLSSETDFLVGSDQYAFVKADLEGVDRTTTPWLVLTVHRPIYTSSRQGNGAGLISHLLETYEPLLLAHEVDLVVVGHVHQAERTCAGLANFTCNAGGPVHMTLGTAGNDYQVPWSGETPPPWIVYRSLDFGIGLFEATRESLAYKFVQGDGTVLDSATFPVRETGMHSRPKLHRRRAARVVQDDDDKE